MKNFFSGILPILFFITGILAIPRTNDANQIKEAVASMECASNTILNFDQKYNLGDLWRPIYFPIIMHIQSFYTCDNPNMAQISDLCMQPKLRSSVYSLASFIDSLDSNHLYALKIHETIVRDCGIDLPEAPQFIGTQSIEQYGRQINLRKVNINIKHIMCVTKAITTAVSNSKLAATWIYYHLELKDSISTIVACGKLDGFQKKICIVSELRNTIKVLLKFWKFLAEKKHLEFYSEIKREIKDQCYGI